MVSCWSVPAIMIRVESLRKVYSVGWPKRKAVEAVGSLDFGIERGEVFGLLGPNGAGKTTTVKMISGLIRPTSGRVILDGHPLSGHSRRPSRLVGAVLEGSRNVYWNLTALENLSYFGRLRGVREVDLKRRAWTLLDEFGLKEKARDVVGTFSRGMQQKLAICCALVSYPPILLADEPTLGLDVASARAIRAKLRHLADEESRTILLTTHNMQLAAAVCDRVDIIDKGRLIREGTIADLVDVLEAASYVVEYTGELSEAAVRELSCIPNLRHCAGDGTSEIRLPVGGGESPSHDLYGVIDIVRTSGLRLLSVREAKPSLEDTFIRLTEEGTDAMPR
jgi:ABC-2 type transport system ATP-binding protein